MTANGWWFELPEDGWLELKKCRWFTHETALRFLPSIRATGLEPRPSSNFPVEVRNTELQAKYGNIVCLRPIGSELKTGSTQSGSRVKLALAGEHLPRGLIWDWSYHWQRAVNRMAAATNGRSRTMLEHFFSTGSVASIEVLPVPVLRLCTKTDNPDDPERWPMLADTIDDDAMVTQDPRPWLSEPG